MTKQTCSGDSIIPTYPETYASIVADARTLKPGEGPRSAKTIGKLAPTNANPTPVTIPDMSGTNTITSMIGIPMLIISSRMEETRVDPALSMGAVNAVEKLWIPIITRIRKKVFVLLIVFIEW